MLKKALFGLVGLVVVLTLVGFLLPASFEIQRSTVIAAPPAKVFGHVADLETWKTWTAWNTTADPECRWEFAGTTGQVGSTMTWDGPQLEQGEMKLTLLEADKEIGYEVGFGQGDMFATGQFTFEALDATEGGSGGTRVTWTMKSEPSGNPLVRWMGVIMKGYAESDFDRGLEGLERELTGGDGP